MFLNFELCRDFLAIFPLLISTLISFLSENTLCMISSIFKLKTVLWSEILSMFINCPCDLEKNIYSVAVEWKGIKCQGGQFVHSDSSVLYPYWLLVYSSIKFWEKNAEIQSKFPYGIFLLLPEELLLTSSANLLTIHFLSFCVS